MAKALEAARKPWFSHAGRLVAAIASTGAALVSVFSALYSYGVVGKAESHQTIGNMGAAWVGLQPAVDTATAIGDTLHLAATVTDSHGSILVGARPAWSSDDPAVATVLKDGTVIASGPGVADIAVAVGDIVAHSRIVVNQHVASVEISGVASDSFMVVLEGAARPLIARPLDARGHVVSAVTASWQVDDSSVAVLDTTGALRGLNSGRTIITAKVGDVSGRAGVAVVPMAGAISAVAGTNQRASAGDTLSQAVVVRVTSTRGQPMQGKLVTFRVADDQGTVAPGEARTDADGRARTVWTLGDLPGRQLLLASVSHLDSALAIVAEADPIASNTRVTGPGEPLSGPAGHELSQPVVVQVSDSLGRPLADLPVSWSVLDGGSVVGLEPRTDGVGRARATWTLGEKAGSQRLSARVGTALGSRGIPPITISAAALAGTAAELVVVSGNDQRGTVGTALKKPIVVRVVDANGNGVPASVIVLSPSAGSLLDSLVTTDSLGTARIAWTLGRTAKDHTLGVHVDGVEKQAKLQAHANPGSPANLSFDDTAQAKRSTRSKSRNLHALVTDLYGNPVPNATVSFSTKTGNVRPTRAASDAHGSVTITWTPSVKPGEQRVSGTVRGTDVSGSYTTQVPTSETRPAKRSTRPHSSARS